VIASRRKRDRPCSATDGACGWFSRSKQEVSTEIHRLTPTCGEPCVYLLALANGSRTKLLLRHVTFKRAAIRQSRKDHEKRRVRLGRTALARQSRGIPRRGFWPDPRSQPAVQDRCAGRALDKRAADCADATPVPTAVSLVRSYPESSRAVAFGREAFPVSFRQTLLACGRRELVEPLCHPRPQLVGTGERRVVCLGTGQHLVRRGACLETGVEVDQGG
jgi:hypothetical protein